MPAVKDLTELVDIDPERVDAVKNPASGFPILLMKAVNAQGGVDEKPDIAGAENVLQQLARLIQSEASEMAVGNFDELEDICLLTEAAHLMCCFRRMERYGDEDDGEPIYKSLDGSGSVSKSELEQVTTYLLKRKVSAAERKRLAAAGHALPDGSYPIENEEDLHNAAILARSGHGDVAAAKRLIAKRAKELGVANPLANETSKETGVPDQNEDKTSETPESQEGSQAEKSAAELVDEAVARAVTPLTETIKGLEAEMAVLKSTPVPGGPVVTVPAAQRSSSERAHSAAEAARFRRLAKSVSDRELIRYYEDKAAELDRLANA